MSSWRCAVYGYVYWRYFYWVSSRISYSICFICCWSFFL